MSCVVCSKSHRENYRHRKEEVKAVVAKLEAKHPTDPLSVCDLAYITWLYTYDQGGDNDDAEAEWSQGDSDNDPDLESDLPYVPTAYLVQVEEALSAAAFQRGLTMNESRREIVVRMYA